MPAVPNTLSAIARRRVDRHPCALCPNLIAGGRAVAGATWVAHLTCYEAAFDDTCRKVPALLAHGVEEAHRLFRDILTRKVARALLEVQQAAARRGAN